MNTRERILTIRLLERLSRHPGLAVDLGIEYSQDTPIPQGSEDPP